MRVLNALTIFVDGTVGEFERAQVAAAVSAVGIVGEFKIEKVAIVWGDEYHHHD